jgi:hypothetical protein
MPDLLYRAAQLLKPTWRYRTQALMADLRQAHGRSGSRPMADDLVAHA